MAKLRFAVALLTMTAASLVMLAFGIVTLFQARRFYTEVIARWTGWMFLRILGVRFELHQTEPFPQTQSVFVSNHTSTLDIFVIIALGLPRTRYFMSGYLKKVVPLGIIGYHMRIFWTVLQDRPAERVQIFKRAARILRETGDSVYLSPEGERITTGQVGHFNKGAFHLATDLRAPIVPLFIAIPKEIDPGKGLLSKPGTVHVYVKSAIDTREWKLEDLDSNRLTVREKFVEWNSELR